MNKNDPKNEIENIFKINGSILNCEAQFRGVTVFCKTRDHRRVDFVPADQVPDLFYKMCVQFLNFYNHAKQKHEIIFSVSYFWLGFISIHPFIDGNGRTAKKYIKSKLNQKGFDIKSFDDLDKLILDHDTQKNMSEIFKIFDKNIEF